MEQMEVKKGPAEMMVCDRPEHPLGLPSSGVALIDLAANVVIVERPLGLPSSEVVFELTRLTAGDEEQPLGLPSSEAD